jgi:ribonuclease E
MLDSELNNHADSNEAAGRAAGPTPVPVAVFQAPQVVFQPPAPAATPSGGGRDTAGRDIAGEDSGGDSRAGDSRGGDSRAGDSRAREPRGNDPGAGDAGDGAEPEAGAPRAGRRTRGSSRAQQEDSADDPGANGDGARPARRARGGRTRTTRGRDTGADDTLFSVESSDVPGAVAEVGSVDRGTPDRGTATEAGSADRGTADRGNAVDAGAADDGDETAGGRRRRRNTRSRSRSRGDAAAAYDSDTDAAGGTEDGATDDSGADADPDGELGGDGGDGTLGDASASGRRRRRKRRRGSVEVDVLAPDDPPDTVVHVREPHNPADDVRSIKGSTRLEAKKQRRREGRESGRRRPPVITESEFLARRESVERAMIVRQRGDRTQIAVLEDGVLVEHYVNRTTHQSYVGNVYLGKVQNVLPSMEAAFVDIGKGRNAVLYAGEVNFDASGLEGQPKRIESALKPGQSVIVQVTKDPVGHKGARLTSMISLPGRYLVYVPGASMTGISRKLPDTERNRLKHILKKVTPEHAGVIVRTAAEGAAEVELDQDVTRLAAQWEAIEKKAKSASAPALLHGEPDLTVRVIRDVFNEDFGQLIVSGDDGYEIIDDYLKFVAPHLAERLSRWEDYAEAGDWDGDVFAAYRIDEQLAKALDRKVWLPSGGSLVIDRTEAMTVVDVNTGKFTGQGGNLEETVTRNNLEAAEEIVRQLRLRDVGGIVVIDFIDMVLESNRDLVLRRLLECLARDRTKHQVAEVTSLGLVQMTRKRVGAGLIEAFSQQCECCNGRGVIVALDTPTESAHRSSAGAVRRPIPVPPPAENGSNGNGRGRGNGSGHAKGGHSNGHEGTAAGGTAANGAAQVAAVADRTAADDRSTAPDTAIAPDSSTTDSAAGSSAAGSSAASNNAAREPGRRTRRGTAGGTAFAAAVQVDDVAAPAATAAPVVTAGPEVSPEQGAPDFVAVMTDAAVDADLAADPAPPVRRTRTRTGSAVARVAQEPAEPVAPAEPEAPVLEVVASEPEAPVLEVVASEPEAPVLEVVASEPEAPVLEVVASEPEAPVLEVVASEPEAPVLEVVASEPEAPVLEVVASEPEAPVLEVVASEPEPEPPVLVVVPTTPEAPADAAPDEPAAAELPVWPAAPAEGTEVGGTEVEGDA